MEANVAEIHSLRNASEIRLEASEWIARLNADRVSAEDRARFDAWRGAHAAHARAYQEVAATWRRLNSTGELVRAVASSQAFAESTRRAIRNSVRASRRRAMLSIAATVGAAAVLTGWWLGAFSLPRTQFQTAIGEHAAVELPDGSSLELNSNSRARVDYTAQTRVIRLERGEAFFKVEHDVHRPFWVVAGGSWVRAVGTAFNVYVQPAGVRVTVSEGMVKVASNAASVSEAPSDAGLARVPVAVLKAGQQVNVNGAASEVRAVMPMEMTRLVSWRAGSVYFKTDRLIDVVEELGRYTTLKIVIEDDALRELRIGGTFETNTQGAEALLMTLEDGFGLQVRRDGRSAYIGAADAAARWRAGTE